MNRGRIVSNVVEPPFIGLPQQSRQQRVPSSRLSRDHHHRRHVDDVIDRQQTVCAPHYINSGRIRGSVAEQRARIRPVEISAGFDSRRQPLCQTKWTSNTKRDVGDGVSPLAVANGHWNFMQPSGRKKLPVHGVKFNNVGRAERQKIDCNQTVIGQSVPRNVAKSGRTRHNAQNATSPGPEVEISKQKEGEATAVVENTEQVAGIATSHSSRDSSISSVTWNEGDDVKQVRGASARTSGVFSRMSTEARQAWIAVRHCRSRTTSAADEQKPEIESSTAHADDTTSGLDVRPPCVHTPSRRRPAKYGTRETEYNVPEPRLKGVDREPVNVAKTLRVVALPRGRVGSAHYSTRVDNFRITSAGYDSRFVDMALEAADRRVTKELKQQQQQPFGDDDDDDGSDVDIRTAAVAKCLSWLNTQHSNINFARA